MPGDSIKKTVGVALGVSLACSLLVSGTVISLESMQEEKVRRTKIKRVLLDLDLLREGESIEDVLKRAEHILIDLETGLEVREEKYTEILDPGKFDLKAMARDPEQSRQIPDDRDIAGIGRVPKYMVVHLVRENTTVTNYVFHIYGKGFYSTLYGVLSLGRDLKAIEGISFYEHAETPGLGGEIESPQWKNKWKGKQAFDDLGQSRIEVMQGLVNASNPDAIYQVDGISGATYTTRGVDQLVKFWLGDDGYGPFLKRRRKEG